MRRLDKVLVLGSGAIKIGEAGEFDYSGSQCLKALKEEGIKSILVNPNVATIQTDTRLADKVYLLPVIPEFVSKVIERERPDGIMLAFGGQTALNCGVSLAKQGILEKYGIKVLGTSIDSIEVTEDRELFMKTMLNNGIPVAKGKPAKSIEEALAIVKELGYPVMIRVAYTLGGKGGGIARNEYELHDIVQRGLNASMIHQVLLEEYIGEWKQIEYEVMRDNKGNSITICNMENMLGMKVHTGDNIVVAPSQTLNNDEYHMLRTAALHATSVCNIIGECNIQFALEPNSERYCAIEINPRLSRSSALASKATGYPIAYMAAKIALGYPLPELLNKITKITTACFEPSLDYIVVKVPRWDFSKFESVNRKLGTQMKSVGEVMAIGRCFEEAIQKAVRMLDIGYDGVLNESNKDIEAIEDKLVRPDNDIIFTITDALLNGLSIDRISKLSSIDPWFIARFDRIIRTAERIKKERLNKNVIKEAKKLGFSDKTIARLLNLEEDDIRNFRKDNNIKPVIKQVDTLAAEWPAKTNYLYLTYGGDEDDISIRDKKSCIVLGAGPYRIGSSVEFDWATVNMVFGLRDYSNYDIALINCNPETVSTDYDICDRLYFEELTLERVLDIYEKENAEGIITCVGGQVANNLTPKLAKHNCQIIGTKPEDVDNAEDRTKFSRLLDTLGIKQPAWQKFTDISEAKRFVESVRYPVLVRPSYVLSGAAMRVVWNDKQLEEFLKLAAKVSKEHPVVISKFITDALEVEVDGVSNGSRVVIGSIIEHIESAGIHSGDAMMVIPSWRLSRKNIEDIKDYTYKIAKALRIKGPFNIQYIVKDDNVYVIECNVRSSRSMPFVSKFTTLNLIELASRFILNKDASNKIDDLWLKTNGFGVKVPQFSFMQLEGADIILGVEMQSTGEVACFGNTLYDALSKALIAANYNLPVKGSALITVGGSEMKKKILPVVSLLKSLGFRILATEHTADFLIEHGFDDVNIVYKISEPERKPNIADLLYNREIDLIINIPNTSTIEKFVEMLDDEYLIRRKAVELGLPVLTTLEAANSFVKTLQWLRENEPSIDLLKPYAKLDD
ncbi:MAG: carbamoyl-phosphate synthase (glutamine-hydrolyzing) large subunit [Candidatus Nitrosothermus koennekii]|nr:MAG: carbamoyl-phosphate synthase (glutamine-hydrolyzing) large subunit [Candidatus Nitrosothermus koennekii]